MAGYRASAGATSHRSRCPRCKRAVDEGAKAAGRDPAEIERAANVMSLGGDPAGWPDELARVVDGLGLSTVLVGLPDEEPLEVIGRLGEETAPRLRELLG